MEKKNLLSIALLVLAGVFLVLGIIVGKHALSYSGEFISRLTSSEEDRLLLSFTLYSVLASLSLSVSASFFVASCVTSHVIKRIKEEKEIEEIITDVRKVKEQANAGEE